MNLAMILDMIADGMPERVLIGDRDERPRGSRTPEHVVFVDEFPTTPTGKVIRRDLVVLVRGGDKVPA